MVGNDSIDSGFRYCLKCLALGAALLALAACDQSAPDSEGEDAVAKIEGSVIYRERMALPPSAEVEVELQDISRADAPASTMATVILPNSAGPPYDFSIAYKPSEIDQRMRYALRATISVDGKLMFTNTDYIDPFSGNPVEVLVRRVPGYDDSAEQSDRPTLENSRWLLETLDDKPAQRGAGDKPLELSFTVDKDSGEHRAAGFSGCNRFSGSYRREGSNVHGSALSFGPLASTRMACDKGTDVEQAYLDMLGKVDSYRLLNGGLNLLADGKVVATFTAGP